MSVSLLLLAVALVLGPSPNLHAQTGDWQLVSSNAIPECNNFLSMQLTNRPPTPCLPRLVPELGLEVWWNSSQPERLWYNDLDVDYQAYWAQWRLTNAVSQLQSRYNLMEADANAVVALGGWVVDGLNAETAGTEMMQMYSLQPGNLYLEITGVNSNANLTLHGTSSDQVYSLLSVTNLGNMVWHTEGVFSGTPGQDWSDLAIGLSGSGDRLFFRGMRWSTNDQSGDGISVTLTNPADDASFDLWPTNLTLQATASATNGTIMAVAFYYGTNLLGVSYGPEYSFTWNNIGRGRYTLYARAFDSNGASATSQAVQVNVDPCYPGLDVVLVMDISSSMSNAPLANAKAAGSNFVQKLDPNFDLVGLASFASTAVINTNLTSDRAGVTALLYGLTNSSGTRIDYGISTGQVVLANSPRHPPDVLPVMILLTDGNAEGGTSNLVFQAAQTAKTNGTRLFTLGIGNGVDTNLLRTIASHTSDFYYAPDSTNLNALYDSIATKLCRTNAAPLVSIISPTNWATFTAGSNLTLQATASDPDGTIASVQFFNNGSFIGTAALTGSVYQLIWSEAPIGTNSLTAVATDNFGLASTSAQVTITVTHPPPTVQITSPTNGQLFVISPTNIVIEADASATGAVITNVQFFCGGTNLGQTASSPYQALWTNARAGSNYTLTAVASDSMGATATNWVTVTVNAMPVVWITYPTNLQCFLEVTNVAISLTNFDGDGTVSQIQLFWRSNSVTLPFATVTNPGTTVALTWSNRHHGAYPITAIATDNRGASTVSGIRVFRVASSNLPPTVSLTNPANGAVFSAGTDLTLCATASSTNGIALVEFFQNGVRLGGDDTPPYQLAVQGLWPGTYQFVAKATDSNGLTTVSAVITNTVQDWVPLSANGYWDPAFHTFKRNGSSWPNTVPLALGASNQVFAFWFSDEYSGIQSWQSCAWLGVSGLDGLAFHVRTMIPYGTNFLLGGGDFNNSATNKVASYDGTGLTDLSFGLNSDVYALYNFKGDIIAGGLFTQANDNTNVQYVAKLSGDAWVPLGSPLGGNVLAIASIGDDLYIGGDFTSAGGDTNVAYVAKLVGTNWVALGAGVSNPGTNISGSTNAVPALAVWNGQLVVGGSFTQAGGDTNAAYLAKWDGTSWSALGNRSFSSDDEYYLPAVSALAVHGNDLFVAGLFDTVTVGSGTPLRVGNVAHLQWDPASLTWNWYAMDLGVTNDYLTAGHPWGGSLLLRPSTISNALDVIVGGNFIQAGPAVSYQVGRWVIGANDCTNAYLPSVYFNLPVSSHTYSPTDFVPVVATAIAAPDSQISSVTFYTNGVFLGAGQTSSDNTNEYYLPTNSVTLQQGTYQFDAVAVDSSNLVNTATIYVNVVSNSAPALSPDQYVVFLNDPPTPLYVLTNDTGAVGIKSVSSLQGAGNTVTIAPGGTNLIFQPAPNTYGTAFFGYSATNAQGVAGFATVTVKIRAKPVVAIGSPADGASFPASTNVVVTGAVLDYDTATTNLAFLINGNVVSQYVPTTTYYLSSPTNFFFSWNPSAASPQTTYAFFSFTLTTNLTTNTPGFYRVSVAAADTYGYVSSSDALTPLTVILTNSFTATNHLTASLDNLPMSTNALGTISYTVISNGFFNLLGKARDPISTDALSYQLLLYQPGTPDTLVANVTPPPRDAAGFHPGGDTTNSLGRLDLSAVQNGTYDLKLIVHGGGGQSTATARFILNTQLKIGQFSFSEQDLVLPVNGIPLTVTRTYNSLNPRSGDFGYSWTYALNSMDVQLDDQRQDVTIGSDQAPFADDDTDANGLPAVVNIRTGGGLDVTLTLPDGRRTTFAFNPRLDPSNGKAYAQWTGPADVYAVLTNFSSAETELDYFPNLHWASDDLSYGLPAFGCHDVPGWVLQTQDGTQYYITRGAPNNVVYDTTGNGSFVNVRAYGAPALTKIVQRTGDNITISPTGIAHYAPNSTNATRSLFLERDAQGRITALYDPNSGVTNNPPIQQSTYPLVRYVYNEDTGNLLQVLKLTDRTAGTYVTNSYRYDNPNFPHYITQIINGGGVPVAQQLYDDSGRLIGIVDANGRTNSFVHDLNARTETAYDRSGQPTIYTYDTRGNVTNAVDALGRQTSKTFDDNGNLTSVTDPLTNTYRFTYDANGNQTSAVDPLGHTNYTAYNSFGQPTAITNALGLVTQYQYDSQGNQTNRVDALNHQYAIFYDQSSRPIAQTDALGRTNAVASYDSAGNLTTLSNSFSGSLTTYAYDANGNRTGASNVWVNPTNSSDVRAITNQSVYDAQGREISSTGPDGNTSSIAYNQIGQQSHTTDQYNKTIGWIYDANGNMIQVAHSDGTVSQMVYDNDDRLSVSDDNHVPGAIANGTRLTYDAAGQVIKSERLTNVVISVTMYGGVSSSVVTSVGGVIGTSTYGYDLAGRQIAVTNAFGNVTQYQYDAAGNQTAIIDALSNRTDYVYDAAGRLIFTTNGLGRVTQYVYDGLNRPWRTIYPEGSFTAVSYGTNGERLAETNQLGLVTTYGYDAAGRITNMVKPPVFDPETNGTSSPQWGFSYDSNGQLASVSNPKHRVTQFTYDQLGRTLTHTLPMGQTASQVYDSFGRIFRKMDFKGQTNEVIYDPSGRLSTNRFYPSGSSVPSVLATYAYDGQDRISQVIEPRGTNAFTYDGKGHVQQIASPEGAVNYEYEPVEGRRTRVYTANTDLRYGYDELGRIKTVSVAKRDGVALSPFEVTTNTYTALGSLQDVYYPNGVHALYQYDVMNRLTNLVCTSGSGQLLAQYIYAPNTNGQWKTATEIQWQSGTTFSTNQFAWFYDNLGRLTNETCSSTAAGLSYTNRYVFDLLGNRLAQTNILGGTTQATSYTYNTNDQLLVESGAAVFTNLYDANGSLTNRASGAETDGYAFSLQNRLASATINRTDSGHTISETINYTYDYKGTRVQANWARSIDGGGAVNGTNIFLNEPSAVSGPNQVLEESPAIGATPTATYTLGSGILSQKRSGAVSHFLPDGHGSTRLLTDTNAGITARFTYDAYGKPLGFTANLYNAPATTLLYSGGQFDADLQQYNLQARYYNPAVGRFGQADPFSGKQVGGANLYAYCEGDPVNSVDPTGMYEIDVHQFLTQYLAEKAGFDKGTSARIGVEAQGPDGVVTASKQPDGSFIDQSRSAFDGTKINHDNMRLYHFVKQSRLVNDMASKARISDMKALGEFFHAQEDTYAHSDCPGGRNFDYYGNWLGMDNGGYYGHGIHGHDPDQTWKDVPKAMKMAHRVYADMTLIFGNLDKKYPTPAVALSEVDESIPDPGWDAIKKDVAKFLVFPPNVIREHLGYNEQVTFGGYNAKIKLLNPSFEINQAYKGHGLPDEVGYKSGTFWATKVRSVGSAVGNTIDSVENIIGW